MAAGGPTLAPPFNNNNNIEESASSPLPVWTAQVASGNSNTDACWQMVETGARLQRRRQCQRLFHLGRSLIIKHLPRDVTEHEIREMLHARGLKAFSVTMSTGASNNNNNGQQHYARVMPCNAESDAEFWDEWRPPAAAAAAAAGQKQQPADMVIRGHRVSVSPSPTDNLLCVARLPRDLRDDEFQELVTSYGPVRRCFLLYSDKTGESKGYGFVEYQSRDCGQRVRSQLDGKMYEGQALACDWLDTSIVTLAGLHSKLLYVDGLPDGFRDMGQFRKLFSQLANPPYCQIALKGGAPQDWGLVEFSQSQEAEDTLRAMDGKLFHNSPIRVAFFIPGVRAINIYMKLLNDTCQNKGKAALLPEPPSDTVFHQLQNLTKQNPAFVHSLQNIILTQIQHLNSSSGGSATSPGSSCSSSGSSTPAARPAASSSQPSSNATLVASAQAALSMLLAAQQQNSHIPAPPPPPPPPQQPVPPPPAAPPTVRQQYYRPQTFPCGLMEAPPLNINVPPPPFVYRQPEPRAPPPPPQPEPVNNLQQTLSALLGTLVQSLSPGSTSPPLTQQQTAAGALLGLLLQMVQNPQPNSPQTSPLAPLSLTTESSYGSGLLTTAPPVGHYNNYLPPPSMNSPSSTNVGSWNHVLGQVRSLSSGPSSLGSTGSRGSSPTSSSSPSTSPARGANNFLTPVQGTKRKFNNHVLPSPEPSPESNYVGQHSQGLGGHYADSYFKRKKRN